MVVHQLSFAAVVDAVLALLALVSFPMRWKDVMVCCPGSRSAFAAV